MAFVIEKELSEEDKKRFESPDLFKGHGSAKHQIVPWRWVIDRERDVFVINMGGTGPSFCEGVETPDEYAISIRGQVVKFDVFANSVGKHSDNTLKVKWQVDKVYLNENPNVVKEEVYQLIREGLETMGTSNCNNTGIVELQVNFKE